MNHFVAAPSFFNHPMNLAEYYDQQHQLFYKQAATISHHQQIQQQQQQQAAIDRTVNIAKENETAGFAIGGTGKKKHHFKSNSFKACKGCKKNLPVYMTPKGKVVLSYDYKMHCIKQCPAYKRLGLICHCSECKESFLDAIAYRMANCTNGKRHGSQQIKAMRPPVTRTANCKGCNKSFSVRENGAYAIPEAAYYTHCLEDCDAYKKLGLITQCGICYKKFLTANSLNKHTSHEHKDLKKTLIRPWMTKNQKRQSGTRSFNSSVACIGCQKRFAAYKYQNKKGNCTAYRYSNEYYIHCIEECNEYKKRGLIKNCDGCVGKFLNTRAFNKHVCC